MQSQASFAALPINGLYPAVQQTPQHQQNILFHYHFLMPRERPYMPSCTLQASVSALAFPVLFNGCYLPALSNVGVLAVQQTSDERQITNLLSIASAAIVFGSALALSIDDNPYQPCTIDSAYNAESFFFEIEDIKELKRFQVAIAAPLLVFSFQKQGLDIDSPIDIVKWKRKYKKHKKVSLTQGELIRIIREEKNDPSINFKETERCEFVSLAPKEREKFRIVLDSNTKQWIYHESNKAVPSGRHVYVYKNGQIFIHVKCRSGVDPVFYHGCFFNLAEVDCAGYLLIEDRKLKLVNNYSGHYKPPALNLDAMFDLTLIPSYEAEGMLSQLPRKQGYLTPDDGNELFSESATEDGYLTSSGGYEPFVESFSKFLGYYLKRPRQAKVNQDSSYTK